MTPPHRLDLDRADPGSLILSMPFVAQGRQLVGCGDVVEAGQLLYELRSDGLVGIICGPCAAGVGHDVARDHGVW